VVVAGAGTGKVDVAILDPHGRKDTIRPSIKAQPGAPETFLVEYVPREPGLHSINIFFSGHQIPNSPFGVGVAAGEKITEASVSIKSQESEAAKSKSESDSSAVSKSSSETSSAAGKALVVAGGGGDGSEAVCAHSVTFDEKDGTKTMKEISSEETDHSKKADSKIVTESIFHEDKDGISHTVIYKTFKTTHKESSWSTEGYKF
jgi:hypothetical protein